MEAGRELDALVAEKVMGEPRPTGNVPDGVLAGVTTSSSGGGNWVGTTTGFTSGDEPVWLPKPYSTDIAAAWEVVGKFAGSNCTETPIEIFGNEDGTWDVVLCGFHEAHADTVQLAICLAALKAVGCSLEEEES